MNGFEMVAIIVLFLVGYWVISAIWPKRKDADDVIRAKLERAYEQALAARK